MIDVNSSYEFTSFLIPLFVLPDINVILNTKYLHKDFIDVFYYF